MDYRLSCRVSGNPFTFRSLVVFSLQKLSKYILTKYVCIQLLLQPDLGLPHLLGVFQWLRWKESTLFRILFRLLGFDWFLEIKMLYNESYVVSMVRYNEVRLYSIVLEV